MLALISAFLFQDEERARKLLEDVSRDLRKTPSVAFRVSLGEETLRVWMKRPGLVRVEQVFEDALVLHVWDGKNYWFYDEAGKEYYRSGADEASVDSLGLGPLLTLYEEGGGKSLLEGASDIKAARDEVGQRLSWTKDGESWKVWIDRGRMVAGEVTYDDEGEAVTVEYKYGPIDRTPKPAAIFTFAPPKDAREMKPEDDADPLLPVGSAAPAFEAKGTDGKPVKLSDFQGKTVVLMFWFLGCTGAQDEFEQLQKLSEEHKDVVFLAVNEEDTIEKIGEYFEKHKLTFRALRADPGALTKPYAVRLYPTNYVIDAEGKIAVAFVGFETERIRALLGK